MHPEPAEADRPNDGDVEIANYETGARKYPFASNDDRDEEFDQKAAENKRPSPYGLTESINETPEETRKSDGVDQGEKLARRNHVRPKGGTTGE